MEVDSLAPIDSGNLVGYTNILTGASNLMKTGDGLVEPSIAHTLVDC